MTTPKATQLSRRNAMAASGVAGLGVAGLGAAASANAGVALDLTNPSDELLARARLLGNADLSARRYDWFDGVVTGVAPDGHTVPFAALRGSMETRLVPLSDREGWQRTRIITGTYFDLKAETPLEKFLNPFTGEHVDVPALQLDVSDVLDRDHATVWRQEGDQIIMEESEAFDGFDPFDPLGAGMTAMTTRVAAVRDVQDLTLTAVPDLGTWTLIGGWPHWLRMDQTPGHCLIQCKRGGGADRLSGRSA